MSFELILSTERSRALEEEEEELSTAAYCVPGLREDSRFFEFDSLDFKVVLEFSLVARGASVGKEEYDWGNGVVLSTKHGMIVMVIVPMQTTRRKVSVSLEMVPDKAEKKKALRPKAASGKDVAVPRWLGKFTAAVSISSCRQKHKDHVIPVFMAPKNATHPPAPVDAAEMQSMARGR